QLVLQAASIGSDGEVMVLDMGEQVKIMDVANTLIRRSGRRDIDIVFTGLRPGEKLGEELFSDDEQRRETTHPLVANVAVPAIASEVVTEVRHGSHEEAARWMRAETAADSPSVRLVP
ncbi:MAG: polysaccharide biosynthesis protein, partial [Mycobacteriaceae bacterium]